MAAEMGDRSGAVPQDVAGALAAARALVTAAESDADEIRAEALRYARQREQEAELLVAKARRVLSVAEEKAAWILAAARSQPTVTDVEAPEASISLANLTDEEFRRLASSPGSARPSRLDRVLASAVVDALDHTFPPPDPRPEG